MKNLFTILLAASLLVSISASKAQSNFATVGSGVLTGSVEVGNSQDYEIDFTNTTSPLGDLYLSWTVVSNTFLTNTPYPGLWEYTLCDKGQCHNGIPSGLQAMDTIHSTQMGFFKLTLIPHAVGSGILKIAVWETGNTASADTVEFQLSSFVGIKENTLASSAFSVFPNPAKDNVNLKIRDGAASIKNVRIYDILGNEVMNVNASSKSDMTKLNVGFLQQGVYLVKMEDKDGLQYSRRMYISN